MLRPSTAIQASRALATARTSARGGYGRVAAFSNSAIRKAGDHAHEDHYDPPSGWLFGVKPGETKEKEGWENIWYYGFFGVLGLGLVAWTFKPDTS